MGSHHGTTNSKESYFLSEDIRMSDASFFNISASEAEATDPSATTAARDCLRVPGAGRSADCVTRVEINNKIRPRYTITGLAPTIRCDRYGLFPESGRLASGRDVSTPGRMFNSSSGGNQPSAAPQLRMWDAKKADSYARGEGIAPVVLKRLSDAVAMDRYQYFEAHGTGTPAGDPQEASAIYHAFFGYMPSQRHAETEKLLHEAALSQPICTALQIILVNVLSALGISPTVVVGHSSVAYLRGQVARLTGDGAMLAAGISRDEAIVLCQQPGLDGKISLAAVNSSSSVTLSGDRDAISRVEQILLDEKKFVRLLRRFKFAPTRRHGGILASVEGQEIMAEQHGYSMSIDYWKDNMVKPVLFFPSLAGSITLQQ
ncbi:uncharacterized protein P174DRAFT_424675 [Aspergillus novofumigatus IBT 16806]|uniref:Polyketide synthase n=1 Tax=Aspergillus novofumigatus (strain IBT 16806) TaxID=1392255 RepID=A0A2I1BYP8_ASPN1|nr:uncharacterized protein P174DRAFT_424675 [Aspergillus novofumigatus IBT 16806]PKX90508.1 hypothetical protein P174DRAFT_424675 [Aspergillus novofumigatus IBT 16806]